MSGFQVVKYKNKRNRRKLVSSLHSFEDFAQDFPPVDEDYFLNSLLKDRSSIEESLFYNELKDCLKSSLEKIGTSQVKNIVCFGLGNISTCFVARNQFALLLVLKKLLASSVTVYDPLFTSQEVKLIESQECIVLKENREGKYQVSGVSLIFMPHCPKQLLNNFLWSNWGLSLSNCLILCNSFLSTVEQNISSVLAELKYFSKSSGFVIEVKLSQEYNPNNIFNDLSLHIFPLSKLIALDTFTWDSSDTPTYVDSDTEFITKEQVPGIKCLPILSYSEN